jgi:hypothetical protein
MPQPVHQQRLPSNEHPWWVVGWPSHPFWHWGIIILGYCGLTILWTWPLSLHFSTHLIEGIHSSNQSLPTDSAQNVWNLWLLRNALTQWQWPLTTDYAFYPRQINLVYQTFGLPNLLLVLPILLITNNPIIAINMLVMLGFVLSALGMYALLQSISKQTIIAFIGGWIFVCSAAHLQVVISSGVERGMLFWLVALHWVLITFVRTAQWRYIAILAALFVILSLSSGYYGLFSIVYAGGLLIVALRTPALRPQRRTFVIVIMSAILVWAISMTGLLMAFPEHYAGQSINQFWDMVHSFNDQSELEDWLMRQTLPYHVISLVDIIVPSTYHPWWGRFFASPTFIQSDVGGFIGWVTIFFMVWGAWHIPSTRQWMWIVIGLLLCACGPYIRLTNQPDSLQFYGPYFLLDQFSIFRNASRPGMFMQFAWIPISMVSAYSASFIKSKTPWLAIILACGAVIESLPPQTWNLVPLHAQQIVSAIPPNAPAGIVFEVPARINDGRTLINQMCHGRPIAAGYLARVPDYYATPLYGIATPIPPMHDVLAHDTVQELGNLGVRYLLVQNDTPPNIAHYIANLGLPLRTQNQQSRLYDVPEPTAVTLAPGAGWWAPEATATNAWRWSKGHAELLLISQTPTLVTIAFTVGANQSTPTTWNLNGASIYTPTVPPSPYFLQRHIQIRLHAGVNLLRIDAPTTQIDPNTPQMRDVALTFVELRIVRTTPIIGMQQPIPLPPTLPYRYFCTP